MIGFRLQATGSWSLKSEVFFGSWTPAERLPFGACPRPVFAVYQSWQRELERQVCRRCHDLAVEVRDRVDALTGLAPISGSEAFGQMVALAVPACDPAALQAVLYDRFRIEVLVTTHGGRHFVRASFQGYNTGDDAAALVAALEILLGEGTVFAEGAQGGPHRHEATAGAL